MSDQQTISATTATQITGLSGHNLIYLQTLDNVVYLSRTSKSANEDVKLVPGDFIQLRVVDNNLYFYSEEGCTVAWMSA